MNKQKLIEGVITKKLVRHSDERGFFGELIRVTDDFFKEGFGQLSHSLMYEGIIKAWHIHKTQVDWWYLAKGTTWVALYDMRKGSKTYQRINEFFLGEEGENVILKIPAQVAHGLKVIKGPAELFYVTSKTYNSYEEGRIPHDDKSIGYDWGKI